MTSSESTLNYQAFLPKTALVEKIISLGNEINAGRVIDLGCGQGVDAIYLQQRTGWFVVGVDNSMEKLGRVSNKISKCNWDVTTPISAELTQYDIGYASFLVHLLSAHQKSMFYRNCATLIRPGGIFVCLTASVEDLKRRTIAQYFPSALGIDLKRYKSVEWNCLKLRSVGFDKIFTESITLGGSNRNVNINYYRDKRFSILNLISENEFTKGLGQMIYDHGQKQLKHPSVWARTLIIAKRSD